MKRRIFQRICLAFICLCTAMFIISCGETKKSSEKAFFSVGDAKYASVKVFSDMEDMSYAEKLVDAFLRATSLPAEISESREEANIVVTTDTSELDLADNEWAISARSGVAYLSSETSYGVSLATDKLSDMIYSSDSSLSLSEGRSLSGLLLSKADYLDQSRLVIYPEFPAKVNRNYDYKISVTQGTRTETLPVYNHTMEYHVGGRTIGGDLYRRFSTFAFSGQEVRVDIKVNRDFESYSVLPSAKNLRSSFANGVISVYLDKPEYFMIRLDSDDNSIMTVFADYPEFPLDIPDKNAENVYYIEGWQQYGTNGLWDIKTPNTTVYIAPGAVLNNRVRFTSAANDSKIFGRGAVIDPYENIYEYDIRIGGTEGAGYKLVGLSGARSLVEGIHMLDARCFNLAVSGKSTDVRNVKMLATMMNTDGITLGGAGSVIDNVYMYVGDNGLVISGCQDSVFKNIIIGTTCAAIFPQIDVDNSLLEDVYVFRTNDGVINHVYNGDGSNGYKDRRLDIVFRNLDCIDCLNLPHLVRSGKMGMLQKYMYFENVNLPSMSGVSNPHQGQGAANKYRLLDMQDTSSTLVTGNTYMNFLNLYIDGEPITSKDQVLINDVQDGNEYEFINDGTYKPVSMDKNKVGYVAPGKVYIGKRLVSFKNEPQINGSTFTLNSVEILRALNSSKTLSSTTVTNSQLVSNGIVKSATVSNGNLYITPLSNTGNLLFPESGEISQYSETTCYTVDLVVKKEGSETVYYLYDYQNRNSGGMSRMITDEIKMYGTGTYKVSMDVKASHNSSATFNYYYDDFKAEHYLGSTVSVSTSWKNLSMTLNVTDQIIDSEVILFYFSQKSGYDVDYIALKNIKLVKVS